MRLVLLGPPGAGKGTQAQLVAERLGVPQVVTGSILRSAVAEGTDLGRRVEAIMQSGQLVPDDLMNPLVLSYLRGIPGGFLLDGYPRTLSQAQYLASQSCVLDRVLELVVPDEAIVLRMSGRRVHPGSGRTYHVHFCPPQRADRDDVTGEPLVMRPDDKPDVVQKRLAVYHAAIQPLIAHYRAMAAAQDVPGFRYHAVSGVGSVAEVTQRLWDALQ